MKTAVIYVHGKGGNTQEAEHYKKLFPACEVIGFDYVSQTPWEAKKELMEEMTKACAILSADEKVRQQCLAREDYYRRQAGMIKQGRTSMALESVIKIIEKLNCPIEQALEFVAVTDEEKQYVMKTLGSEKKNNIISLLSAIDFEMKSIAFSMLLRINNTA